VENCVGFVGMWDMSWVSEVEIGINFRAVGGRTSLSGTCNLYSSS
jgi:hypothetical protein